MTEKTRTKLLQEIYERFKAPIMPEAVQTKDFGNTTNGYIMGYLVERINEVLVPLNCTWDYKILPINLGEEHYAFVRDTQGEKRETISVLLRISIYGQDGEVLISKESFGGIPMINNNLGDTLKGAQTDALKKAFSYLGIGNDAFCGRIDDQLLSFYFELQSNIEKVRDLILKTIGKESITDQEMLLICSKINKKAYKENKNVTLLDTNNLIKKLEANLNSKKIKKAKVTNEPEDNSREDKEKTISTGVDQQIEDDGSVPF